MSDDKPFDGVCAVCHFAGRVRDFWGEHMCPICARTPTSLDDGVRATIAWTVRLLQPKKRNQKKATR